MYIFIILESAAPGSTTWWLLSQSSEPSTAGTLKLSQKVCARRCVCACVSLRVRASARVVRVCVCGVCARARARVLRTHPPKLPLPWPVCACVSAWGPTDSPSHAPLPTRLSSSPPLPLSLSPTQSQHAISADCAGRSAQPSAGCGDFLPGSFPAAAPPAVSSQGPGANGREGIAAAAEARSPAASTRRKEAVDRERTRDRRVGRAMDREIFNNARRPHLLASSSFVFVCVCVYVDMYIFLILCLRVYERGPRRSRGRSSPRRSRSTRLPSRCHHEKHKYSL